MIRYALHCDNTHDFDGWFSDSADFDVQRRRGLVTCPVCDSREVEKQMMAPAVASTREPADGPQDYALLDAQDRIWREMARAFHEKVLSKAEDVGGRFAEEARRIHLGEVEERAIRGRATLQEVRDLAEEGVPFAPIPALPDEAN